MKRTKYVIHPGYVDSKNDGQKHWISRDQLIRLYGVNQQDCLSDRDSLRGFTDDTKIIHLHPMYNGNYFLPSE